MELLLIRSYYADGTNGKLYGDEKLLCYTIELPWKDNHPCISCIPEGRYAVERRWSPKFGYHLWIRGVPGRSLILMHPANDALQELEGCIAPVSLLQGEGRGGCSKVALSKVMAVLHTAFEKKETPFLNIQSTPHENSY
ncbi:MAG: DUF5675 family protein [Flavisolibacter sp.]